MCTEGKNEIVIALRIFIYVLNSFINNSYFNSKIVKDPFYVEAEISSECLKMMSCLGKVKLRKFYCNSGNDFLILFCVFQNILRVL